MKVISFISAVLLILLFSAGCGKKNETTSSNNFVSSDKAFVRPSAPEVTVSMPENWQN